jgi:L-iditol 2-dehydrogenase
MKMRAAVYSGAGHIAFREVERPTIGRDEVLLKVHAATLCGTDIKMFTSGYRNVKEGEERILGHEIAAEVWEVGDDVEGYGRGMRVIVAPNMGCGHCRYCRMGHTELCPDFQAIGIHIDGGFAEYVRIPGRAVQQGLLIAFGDTTPYDEAVLAEPLACCYNAYKSVNTKPGDAVLVVGAGPMGALHLQMQRLAGARLLMVADIAQPRLELVRDLGPDILINSAEQDLYERVMELTGGEGADVIITAVPVPQVQQQALKLAAKLGRINLFGGMPKGSEGVKLDTNIIHYNGIVVTGTTGAAVPDYETAMALIEDEKIKVRPIISRRFKVEEIQEAFRFAMSGEGLKTMIEF